MTELTREEIEAELRLAEAPCSLGIETRSVDQKRLIAILQLALKGLDAVRPELPEDCTAYLDEWFIQDDHLYGKIYGDKRGYFKDGDPIREARIVHGPDRSGIVLTQNGQYLVGRPIWASSPQGLDAGWRPISEAALNGEPEIVWREDSGWFVAVWKRQLDWYYEIEDFGTPEEECETDNCWWSLDGDWLGDHKDSSHDLAPKRVFRLPLPPQEEG